MSDPDAAPDPMDQAYVQAEALLDDDAARAARRARVLAAVAGAAAAPQVSPAPSHTFWSRGGWLAAASVAGVSVFIATQINRPPTFERPAAPPAEEAPAAPATAMAPPAGDRGEAPPAAAPPPATKPSAQEPELSARARGALDEAPPVAALPPLPVPLAPPPPPPPPAPAAPPERRVSPTPAQAPPRAQSPAASGAFSAGRRPEPSAQRAAAEEPRASRQAEIEESVVVTAARRQAGAAGPADQLRDAAAGGRSRELSALLARGVPIDAADDDGETALMKAIQAKEVDAAALLRRRGASLDLKNHAGRSARDMAAALADPALNKALGLER